MQDNSTRESRLDLFINRDSSLLVNINFEGKEYSIQRNGNGLKISCLKGIKVETPDENQEEWLIIK
jgi:hypothetical protein